MNRLIKNMNDDEDTKRFIDSMQRIRDKLNQTDVSDDYLVSTEIIQGPRIPAKLNKVCD